MSVIQLMVTIIIVTILVTVILGVVSYAAYWLRRARRPTQPQKVETGPRFFFRYLPEGTRDEAVAEEAGDEVEAAAANGRRRANEPREEPSLVRQTT